jgi:hypothetical protein
MGFLVLLADSVHELATAIVVDVEDDVVFGDAIPSLPRSLPSEVCYCGLPPQPAPSLVRVYLSWPILERQLVLL